MFCSHLQGVRTLVAGDHREEPAWVRPKLQSSWQSAFVGPMAQNRFVSMQERLQN